MEPSKPRVRVSPATAPAGSRSPTTGQGEARLKENPGKCVQVGFVLRVFLTEG